MGKPDHYELLGISPKADTKAVKAAFRKAAKRLHPDLRQHASDGDSSPEMLELLEAYKVLVSPEARRTYDRARRKTEEYDTFDYRTFLLERRNDPESVAKLVVFDLLHSREDSALQFYERLKTLGGVRLERYFERSEAMDIELCIAEEYAKRGKTLKAYPIYRKLIAMEFSRQGFGYYFAVVLRDFRELVCTTLRSEIEGDDYLEIVDEASQLGVPGKDGVFLLARKAELLARRGDRALAAEALLSAEAILPSSAYVRNLRKRLKI